MSFVEIKKIPFAPLLYGEWLAFLCSRGLRDEGDADTLALIREERGIVACGALSGNVIKQLAVLDGSEGEGFASKILSALVTDAAQRGIARLFLSTKPENRRMFLSLGFFELCSTPDACLMENTAGGIEAFLSAIPKEKGTVGAVVANCNPFTYGHQFLIEAAAASADTLHLFILSDDKQAFSADERYNMAVRGTEHIKNIFVHRGGDYIVSRATFPSYFIKDAERVESVRTELDIALFGGRIAPTLGITKRFVGTEPYCAVTRAYNEQMKLLLPDYGVELIEIERKDGISASHVRRLLEGGCFELVRPLVPQSTYDAILNHT